MITQERARHLAQRLTAYDAAAMAEVLGLNGDDLAAVNAEYQAIQAEGLGVAASAEPDGQELEGAGDGQELEGGAEPDATGDE